MVRCLALDFFRMAQDVVSGQGYLGRWVKVRPSESVTMLPGSGGTSLAILSGA
jgi:hypothetical protein